MLVLCPSIRAADSESIDWDSHSRLRAAMEVFWQNSTRVTTYRGTGVCSLVTHLPEPLGHPTPERRTEADFRIAGRENLLRMHIQFRNRRSTDEQRRELLFDGRDISVVRFAPNDLPHGCSVEIHDDKRPEWYMALEASRDDFRSIVRNPLVPSRERLELLKFRATGATDNEEFWEFESPSGLRLVYFAIPGDPCRLVRHEVLRPDQSLLFRLNVDWEFHGDLVQVRSVKATQFQRGGPVMEASEIAFTNLELNSEVSLNEVSLTEFAGCNAGRIIDRRSERSHAVLPIPGNIQAELKSHPSPAAAAEELKQMGPPSAVPAPIEPKRFSWLLVANGVLMAVLGVFVLLRHLRRAP